MVPPEPSRAVETMETKQKRDPPGQRSGREMMDGNRARRANTKWRSALSAQAKSRPVSGVDGRCGWVVAARIKADPGRRSADLPKRRPPGNFHGSFVCVEGVFGVCGFRAKNVTLGFRTRVGLRWAATGKREKKIETNAARLGGDGRELVAGSCSQQRIAGAAGRNPQLVVQVPPIGASRCEGMQGRAGPAGGWRLICDAVAQLSSPLPPRGAGMRERVVGVVVLCRAVGFSNIDGRVDRSRRGPGEGLADAGVC